LISVVMLALLSGVLSAAVIVTLRQQDNTEGRLNLSHAEQSVGMWMPNDLASAQSVTKNPGASPCGAPVCDGIDLSAGSNVLMLTWTVEVPTGTGTELVTTNVSYHMTPSDDGQTFELWRVECEESGGSWECSTVTLLRGLPGPPAGSEPSGWVGGVGYGTDYCVPPATDPPAAAVCSDGGWVIGVSLPLAADATEDSPTNVASGDAVKDANRVIVTIDGGGGGGDSSGGRTRISITAGGTNRATIDAASLLGAPSFEEARSRCGGPLSLIVDESLSIQIAGASTPVLNAVRTFVETLVGTPVQIQIVEFEGAASVLGTSSGEWHRYFDMLDIDGDVARLLTDRDLNGSTDGGLLGQMAIGNAGGDTNWEEGLFRTFYTSTGGIPEIYPETVVFFTDGTPTSDRQMGGSYKTGGDLSGQPSYSRPPYANYQAGVYNQVSFNRAAYVATQNRARTRLVGVGVGGINDSITWVDNPGAGVALSWERGSGSYYMEQVVYQTNRTGYQIGTAFSSNLDYERRQSGSWSNTPQDISPDTYFANNPETTHTGQSDSDGYRIRRSSGNWNTDSSNNTPMSFTSALRYVNEIGYFNQSNNFRVTGWGSSSPEAYKAASATERQRLYRYTSTSWTTIDEATYNAGNYTGDDTDGFRVHTLYTWLTQAQYDAGVANPEPGATYHAVAKRWAADGGTPTLSEGNAPDWEPVASPYGTASEQLNNENNTGDGYRATRTNPATPPPGGYVGYTPATTSTKSGSQILANLVAGDDTGVPYTPTPVDNSTIANMYVLPPANQGGFSQLGPALKSVALGECGGTLTLQTKVGTITARDPFTYQNTAAWDEDGQPLTIAQKVKTTNQQNPSGTFDFTVPGGTTVTVEIRPQNFAELDAYTPQGWSCRAGVTPVTDFETFPILDETNQPTGWSGIRVPISANSAVACTLNVSL
jgi:hypothetical protein